MSWDLSLFRRRVAALARQGVFVGTSSWKYPGWRGLIYEEARYLTRGKFSEAKFERECLSEYAETFSSVCVDAGYYKFPSEHYLEGLCKQVPAHFRFSFKVTDLITLKNFPNLPRFGPQAGRPNAHFLDPELFRSAFLKPCEPFREKLGVLMFEFSQFHAHEFASGREFVRVLDEFLEALPGGWDYGVEMRNRAWLKPEYFEVLRSHGVAHVYNSWTRMPPVSEQLAMAESQTASFEAARFLLKPGRAYEEAVRGFQPYDSLQEPNAEARAAARSLIERVMQKRRRAFFYVNNRLEGCAPLSIDAVMPLDL